MPQRVKWRLPSYVLLWMEAVESKLALPEEGNLGILVVLHGSHWKKRWNYVFLRIWVAAFQKN